MPELPEVETIRLQMEDELKEKKIESIKVLSDKPLKNVTLEEFAERVEGASVKAVKRRAKILIIELSTGDSLLIHLKLTGRLLYLAPSEPIEKHTHLIFNLNDGNQLRFWDLRQFGYVKLVSGKLSEAPELKGLGPEALELSLGEFSKLMKSKRSGKIKPLLMNQNFIAGIGNIYSDEALFYAAIHPERDVSALKEEEIARLYEGIRKIMLSAISYRGSSMDDYVDLYGKQGDFVSHHKVYRKTGQVCEKCGGSIKRIKLGGRSAHFCPKCQV